jgi:hypothetical protein
LELFQVNECLLKTLLHHILGVLVGVGERHRAEQHYRPVTLNQQFERFRVAALGGRYERGVARHSAAGLGSRYCGVHLRTAGVLARALPRANNPVLL